MKHTGRTIGCLLLATMICVGGCSSEKPPSGKSLVINGGFENVAGTGDPIEWWATRVPQTADHVVFELDSTQKHGGRYSVSVLIEETHPDTIGKWFYNWTQTLEGFEVGATYELSGWVRTEGVQEPPSIVVQCWDEQNANILKLASTRWVDEFAASSDWTHVRTTFTVPKGTGETRVRAGIGAPNNTGGKVWFDDLSVKRL